MRAVLSAAVLFAAAVACAHAAEVRVLSAGAVEPGLHAFAALAKRETGHTLAIQFNTAPQIAKRLAAGDAYDLLIAPPAVIKQAAADGKVVAESRAPVGRVGAGIIVRSAAAAPDVSGVEALRKALVAADSVVYNTASTGLYLDRLFEKMGVLDAVKPKSARYATGAEVMEHVIRGKGNEIGFGATTEIRMYEPKGLKMIGPLPADVQNYTAYDAALMTAAGAPDAARAVLRLMGSPAGKAAFVSGGVE